MDVDRLLDFERRTGVKNADIDEFNRKAEEVQRAIQGLLNGEINPDDVKIEGIETEEEKKRKEAEREEYYRKLREKNEQLRLQRKKEERERWWSGAEVYFPKNSDKETRSANTDEEDDKRQLALDRYTINYSKWDQWVPDDEATREEEAEKQREEEKRRNEEFEKNNPEFCQQFISDMEQRKKTTEKKQESADVQRLKGNRYFKNKEYELALEQYQNAMKSAPFDSKLTLNIAQTYIKLKDYEEALEFLERTLYLDARNIKALSRKAFIFAELRRVDEAINAVNTALKIEPSNKELLTQQLELFGLQHDILAEESLQKLNIQSTATSTSTTAGEQRESSINDTTSEENEVVVREIDLLRSYLQQTQEDIQLQEKLVSSTDKLLSLNVFNKYEFAAVYFRTSQTLHALLQFLTKFNFNLAVERELALLRRLWSVLSYAITGQRTSQQTFLESGYYTSKFKEIFQVQLTALQDRQESILKSPSEVEVQLHSQALSELEALFQAGLQLLLSLLGADIFNLETSTTTASDGQKLHSPKARQMVLTDKRVTDMLATLLGTVTTVTVTSDVTQRRFSLLELALMILKEMVFAPEILGGAGRLENKDGQSDGQQLSVAHAHGTSIFQSLSGELAMNAVVAIGSALRYAEMHASTQSRAVQRCMQFSVEVLLGISQIEAHRGHFAVVIPAHHRVHPRSSSSGKSASSSGGPASSSTVVHAILRVMRTHRTHLVNCIAILMNASITGSSTSTSTPDSSNSSNAVIAAIYDAQGFDDAIAGLSNSYEKFFAMKEVDRTALDDFIEVLQENARRAGLLVRLLAVDAVKDRLSDDEKHFRDICKKFQAALQIQQLQLQLSNKNSSNSSQHNEYDRLCREITHWLREEHRHLLRILGSVLPGKVTPRRRQIALQENVFPALLEFFPRPREELYEVTAQSVVLPPRETESLQAPAVGNAARCLMLFMDDLECAASLFSTESSGRARNSKHLAVERLVCALANCVDVRVRKNLAILLAKACRVPGVRDRLSELRGLQMMLEMQNQL